MTDTKDTLKQRALRAAKAVTLSAAFVGAAACADETQGDNNGWDVGGQDAADTASDTGDTTDTAVADATDIAEDSAADTGDVIEMDVSDTVEDTSDTVDGDASVSCSPDFDDVCPESCNASNDADCCEDSGGSWSKFADAGACAVPGPFVPPALVA
ncbi:MAG: hypothetical protein ACQEVA_11105 [Myxococcota bacterium]